MIFKVIKSWKKIIKNYTRLNFYQCIPHLTIWNKLMRIKIDSKTTARMRHPKGPVHSRGSYARLRWIPTVSWRSAKGSGRTGNPLQKRVQVWSKSKNNPPKNKCRLKCRKRWAICSARLTRSKRSKKKKEQGFFMNQSQLDKIQKENEFKNELEALEAQYRWSIRFGVWPS